MTIREYRPAALKARIQSYRPEDESAVEAMCACAAQARQAGDPVGWVGPLIHAAIPRRR